MFIVWLGGLSLSLVVQVVWWNMVLSEPPLLSLMHGALMTSLASWLVYFALFLSSTLMYSVRPKLNEKLRFLASSIGAAGMLLTAGSSATAGILVTLQDLQALVFGLLAWVLCVVTSLLFYGIGKALMDDESKESSAGQVREIPEE
jgi:hypothetical protein